ncbi:DUF1707 domain-containing protein [Lipingzhangella sp. LS1_29]|uniref:DUF1707 domain-containing protein n=1 Tax=Lipingzhangella rawalii TaxID=2055835 RepID=A0ABU2H4Z9_9ACTN|nr:DUF1707 domain-containing protein [Lipingzhangella rawalii]MDS1269934.1 DUF1707 domain-containing protein [Lipingzhangella rawalii]
MSDAHPDMRISDADRDRVAKTLQEHFAQGRIDNDEFHTRLADVYAARTRGELEPLTADLPEQDLYQLRASSVVEAGALPRGGVLRDPALVIPWLVWGGVSLLNFGIWLVIALAGGDGFDLYPWWIWVAGPWGVVMLIITVAAVLVGGLAHRSAR